MENYLYETPLLNYSDHVIQNTLKSLMLPNNEKEKILKIYNFVRDDIKFGYNVDDAIPASKVIKDGYGQCNTKGILFMALLRAVKIPCRIHGFAIHKELQKGAMTGIVYKSAPEEIIHSWVEVYFNNEWLEIEGFILDLVYLRSLQSINRNCTGSFCGYGVDTTDFTNPQVFWDENNTYIQKEGIIKDYGVYNTPDDFFQKHSQRMTIVKKIFYINIGRHLMNRNVNKIRLQYVKR